MFNKTLFFVVEDDTINNGQKKSMKETSKPINNKIAQKKKRTFENETYNTNIIGNYKILKSKELSLEKEIINLFFQYGVETHKISKMRQENQSKSVYKNYYSNNKYFFRVRTKMVDWMIDVFNSFRSNFQTVFHAICLMDQYINKSRDKIEITDIHQIGITCIYISSKYEDVFPLSLASTVQFVGHNSFKE